MRTLNTIAICRDASMFLGQHNSEERDKSDVNTAITTSQHLRNSENEQLTDIIVEFLEEWHFDLVVEGEGRRRREG